MSTGDQTDVLARLNAVLPPWFNAVNPTPILTGLLSAFSYIGSFFYSEGVYVQLQTRITTATDQNLDLIANDFFGANNFNRGAGEGDTSYRNRILASILQERATRRGMVNVLTLLTGKAPVIFEPSRPMDCGGYSIAGCGYGVAGGWSNPDPTSTNYQCFITVFSPVVSSIASVPGWNINYAAWTIAGTRTSWINSNSSTNALNAAQIYQAINATKVEGTICWVSIVNP